MTLSTSRGPASRRHPLKPRNPTALDAATSHDLRRRLHATLDSILNLREAQNESQLSAMLPALTAALYRDSLGEEAFDDLVRCEGMDRLDQLLTFLEIGGLIAGTEFDEYPSRVWRSDAAVIHGDLLTLYDRQPKDGPPSWLVPRGNERSDPKEKEHQRRAVVWQRFISQARGAKGAGTDEVAEAYGVSPRTLSNWVSELSDEPGMERRLDAATGFVKDESGERLAAIYDGVILNIIWMKQRHEHYGRGKPGHYKGLLIAQANEYRRIKGKKEL